MKKSTIITKKGNNFNVIERELYETDNGFISYDDNYLTGLINFEKVKTYKSKTITAITSSINAKITSFCEYNLDFIKDMYQVIYNLNTKEDINKLIKLVKKENEENIKKNIISMNLKTINNILKDQECKRIETFYDAVDINMIDSILKSRGHRTLTSQIESRKSNDNFNDMIDKYKDLFLAFFINKILVLYYNRIFRRFNKLELEEMNIELSKGDNNCIDKIFREIDNKPNNSLKKYCEKIISDLAYSNFSDILYHTCWNDNCSNGNVNDCSRVRNCGMDIRKPKYSYVNEGVMFINEKGSIERCVVEKCDNYERRLYIPRNTKNEPEPIILKNKILDEEPKSVIRNRMANITTSSSGMVFSDLTKTSSLNSLTQEEKKSMLSMNERAALARQEELKKLNDAKNELLDASKNKSKTKIKLKTKKDI